MIIGTQIEECVVYKITNLVNSREYIGVSTRFLIRMQQHGREPNKKIQADIDKFNLSFEDNFDKEIIFQGTKEECYLMEEKMVPKDKNKRPYYNMVMGGIGGIFKTDGENSPSAKLSNKQVEEIKNLLSKEITQNKIAKMYNVHPSTISGIWLGNSRREVNGPISKHKGNGRGNKGENSVNSTLSDKEVEKIRNLAKDTNMSLIEIREHLNIKTCKSNITSIIYGGSREESPGPIRGIHYDKQVKVGAKSTISDAIVANVKIQGYMTKDTYVKIGKDNGIMDTYASKIIRGKTRIEVPGPILGRDYMKRGEGNA